MSARGPRVLPLAWAQAALLLVLVAERVVGACLPGAGARELGAGVAVLGAWITWPFLAFRPRGPAVAGTAALALATGLAALAWREAASRLAAGGPAWRGDLLPWALVAIVLLLDPGAVRRVLTLARIEASKLRRARLLRLGLPACVGLTLLSGLTHEPLPAETGWSAAAGMLGAGFATAQIFVLVLGATSIAGEASQGTLKMILPHAYRRSDWVLAKALALSAAAATLGAAVLATALLRVAATQGFGDVTLRAEGFGGEPIVSVHATAEVMRGHLAATALAQGGALLGTLALGLLLSCVVTNVVGALSSAFLAFAALRLSDLVLALDQDTLRRLFTWAPERLREVTGKLGQGLSEGWEERLPAASLLLTAATVAALLLLATRAFSRKDLHV